MKLKHYRSIGLGTIFVSLVFQKLFRINFRFKYLIHFTSRVTVPSRIKIIDSDSNESTNTISSFASSTSLYMNGINGINFSSNVLIASGVKIISANHTLENRNDFTKGNPINIENNVWLATNSVILQGVTIGENSIVAAGSVVTKDVPPNVIVAGNPARVIKDLMFN